MGAAETRRAFCVLNCGNLFVKLLRFHQDGDICIGKLEGEWIVDLSRLADSIGNSMRVLLERLPEFRTVFEAATSPRLRLGDVRLAAPIGDPQKFIAIGMNYPKHAAEVVTAGLAPVTEQAWFAKSVSSINGPYDLVSMPSMSQELDYEGELAYVIGRRCRNVRADEAMDMVAGYMVANDLTVRDWLRSPATIMLAKSFDTHGPIGPWITLKEEIPNPYALELRTFVNGDKRQRGLVADLIHNIAAQIEYVSACMTLEPGDIVSTGTPSGTGISLGKMLKPGDVVRVEIDRLGYIENRVQSHESGLPAMTGQS